MGLTIDQLHNVCRSRNRANPRPLSAFTNEQEHRFPEITRSIARILECEWDIDGIVEGMGFYPSGTARTARGRQRSLQEMLSHLREDPTVYLLTLELSRANRPLSRTELLDRCGYTNPAAGSNGGGGRVAARLRPLGIVKPGNNRSPYEITEVARQAIKIFIDEESGTIEH